MSMQALIKGGSYKPTPTVLVVLVDIKKQCVRCQRGGRHEDKWSTEQLL